MDDKLHTQIYNSLLRPFWDNVEWAFTQWGVINHSSIGNRIRYDYRSALTLNASISLDHRDNIQCNINMGAALSFYDFFMQLAATADINNSGTCTDYLTTERYHDKDRFTNYSWLPDMLREDSRPLCPRIVPKDSLRFALGNQFVSFAILFLVLHEEAHYLNGHLHLLDSLGIDSHLAECPEEIFPHANSKDLISLLKQMELEADSVAFSVILHGIMDANVLKTTSFGQPITRDDWCNLSMLTVSSICCLFELAGKRNGVSIPTSSHPSAGCRWLNLLDTYRSFILSVTGNELSPNDYSVILDNIGIVSQMLDSPPVDIKDVLASVYSEATSSPGGPADEYITLGKESVIHRKDRNRIRSEVLKKIGINFDSDSIDSDSSDRVHEFGMRIPLSAFTNLRRS